jgi:hypothetical protein
VVAGNGRQHFRVDLGGVTAYLKALQEDTETSRQELTAQWAEITGPEFRDGLARALATL